MFLMLLEQIKLSLADAKNFVVKREKICGWEARAAFQNHLTKSLAAANFKPECAKQFKRSGGMHLMVKCLGGGQAAAWKTDKRSLALLYAN